MTITARPERHLALPTLPVLAALAAVWVSAAIALGTMTGDLPGSPVTPPGETGSPAPTATPSPRPTPQPIQTATPSPTASPTPSPSPTPVPATPAPPTPIPATPAPPPPTPPTPAPAPDYSRPGGIYLDVLTRHRAYAEWSRTLLDTIFMVGADYAPGDLVDTGTAGLNGGYLVRSIVIDDLRQMAAAARAAGAPLRVVSGYRSHAQQQATFDHWVSVGGYEQALRTSARPGHSEHQLGTTLDFTSEGGSAPWEYADWATTPAGSWMAANAWRYGFVMSYPAGAYDRTGYDYEPWHYRYVGRTLAAHIHASGLTPREVLWTLQ